MFPDPPKRDQHVPDIGKCEVHVLTSQKVSHLKVNIVAGALKSSKPSFGWQTQHAVAATTTFSGTRFLYYMCHRYQCYSNLVTTPSSCVLLTLQSVLNQNLTCQLSSSYCRIPMILDTLKNELKPSFTADSTKGFLQHAEKNEEHFFEGKAKGFLYPRIVGRITTKNIFHPSHGIHERFFGYWTN